MRFESIFYHYYICYNEINYYRGGFVLNVNEKLIRSIKEVNYLRADNVDRYRVIIRYFYEEYEKIHYWLYKEDVFEMMINTGLFNFYTMEQCVSDLNALVEWGNLTPMQDVSKVNTIEEFKNRKYRYQLSEYTIEIERMTLKLENLEIEGASLEPSLLERIHNQILDIDNLYKNKDNDMEVSVWWNNLNNDFIRLNRNYQDYIRTLNSAKANEMMKTKEFLIFKEKIINYLRSFVKGLQEHAMILELFIKNLSKDKINDLIKRAISYEMSIPRIDSKINPVELEEVFQGRWNSIYNWFVGENGISEVNRMSDITNEIIRKITRYAQQISEYYNSNANKAEEYRHLSNVFGKCQTLEEAHQLSSLVFGVDQVFHIREFGNRITDSIDSGVYEEESNIVCLEPRTRIKGTKTTRKPAQNYELEKNIQKLEILKIQEMEEKILKKFIQQRVIDFSKIEILDSYSRKLLLGWLSRGLASKNHRAKIESGRYYFVDDSSTYICKVKCEDGNLEMLSYKICFEEDEHESN